MYTVAEFAIIEKGLEHAKDKGKYLESFEISYLKRSEGFQLIDDFHCSFNNWKFELINEYKEQLEKEHREMLKQRNDLLGKTIRLTSNIEKNRKRYREYTD